MREERAGKGPGEGAGLLSADAEQVIEGWLEDLRGEGNGLLGSWSPSRLRRRLKEWIAGGGTGAGLDRLALDCAPSDLEAAAEALRRRASGMLSGGKDGDGTRRAILAAARGMRRAAREGGRAAAEARRSAGDTGAGLGELTEALSRAAGGIQRATSAAGIARAVVEGATRICEASSAVWWEQQGRSLLAAKTSRGLRLRGRTRGTRVSADFWQSGAGRGGQVVELSPERAEHALFLQNVGASRGVVVRARAGGRWLGALSVHDGVFDRARVDLLMALVQQAAFALHALGLRAEPGQLMRGQRDASAEIDVSLSSTLTLDELLQAVCRSAARLAESGCCFLFLADPGEEMRLRARECVDQVCRRLTEGELSELAGHARGRPMGESVWQTGGGLPERSGTALWAGGIRSLLGVALRIREEPVGALLMLSTKRNAYGPERRQLLVSFAGQAARVIENLQLVEEMQRRLLEMADLTWVSTRITSTLEVEKIAAAVADAAAKALDVPRVALFVVGKEGSCEPVPGGQLGLPEDCEEALEADEHVGTEALVTSAPQTVTDAEGEGRAGDALVQRLGARSLLCVPMTAQQGLQGLLVVGDERPRSFRLHEVALLSAYASQSALALQSALLYQDVVRHVNQLSNLIGVSQTLASSLDVMETLQRVVDSASELLEAPVCSLMLMDPETGELAIKAARGMKRDHVLYTSLKPGEGLAGRAAQSGVPLASTDVGRDGRFRFRGAARAGGLQSAMAAPLVARGRTVGVLNMYRRSPQEFTGDDKRLVTALANSAAVAIENARLYEEAQERAQFLTAMMEEINHRMRNTLQAVAGLLRMELEHPELRSTEEALRRGIARIQSVAVVHEMMRARELQLVDIKQAARRICQLTCESVAAERSIDIRVSGARVMLPSQQATSVAMILGELTDNSARHGVSKRQDGRIAISFAEGGGNVVIEVSDNGVGLREGFDLESMSGLGLKVVRGLVEEELGGTLELETKGGLRVRAKFPKHV